MAKRLFVNDVQKLEAYAGEPFSGEDILSVTNAVLEPGVSHPVLALMPREVKLNLRRCRLGAYSDTYERDACNDAGVMKALQSSVNPMARHALA